jgi:hypothetical protein
MSGPPLQTFTGKVVQRNPGEILKDTRATLHSGRGNVWTDIKKDGGASYKRTIGAMAIGSSRDYRGASKDAIEGIPVKFRSRIKDVLPFIIMGAGNCMEHAVVTMFQINHKYAGSHIWLMSWGGGDHQFLLKGDSGDIELSTVIDTWDPSRNGKPYKGSDWHHKNNRIESPDHFVADGKDYLSMALGRMGDTSGLQSTGISEGEKKSKGIDFSSYEDFKESSPEFSIYNF